MASEIAALVIVPQVEELDPLVQTLRELGHTGHVETVGRVDVTRFDGLQLGVALGGNGKVQFGVQTQHLLDMLPHVSTVVCAGAAGGLADDVRWGDVVVGSCSVEHDYKIRFSTAPAPIHPAGPGATAYLDALLARAGSRYRVLHGPIASGDEDIVDRARARELHEQTGALCVAWEGAGGARAAKFSGRAFLEMRVITDSADENAATDFHNSLQAVMPHLAEVIATWALEATRPDPRSD